MAFIPKWLPGKLYQPGALVQPNYGPAVVQTALNNAGFESGDTNWELDQTFAILNAPANFEGSWHLRYTGLEGAATPTMFAPGETSGVTKELLSEDLGITWVESAAEDSNSRFAASNNDGSTFIVVSANEVWSSADGAATWTQRTETWSAATTIDAVFWDPTTALFYVWEAENAFYNTSPDGTTWTRRAFPVDDNNTQWALEQRTHATDGTTLCVGLYFTGAVYTSTDGINWTNRENGQAKITGMCYAPAIGEWWLIEEDQTLWSSPDATTWTEEVTASANIYAELAAGGCRLAWSPVENVMVAMIQANSDTGETDYAIATSPDGVVWTARAGYEGNNLQYSPYLEKFLCTQDAAASEGAHVYQSQNGRVWVELGTAGTSSSFYGPIAESGIAATYATNDTLAETTPGHEIRAHVEVITETDSAGAVGIAWYDAASVLIGRDFGDDVTGASTVWREASVIAFAPSGAAFASPVLRGSGSDDIEFDSVVWEYARVSSANNLVFEATQAEAGFSSYAEPDWPATVSLTVVDNEVTWTGRAANLVTLEAKAIMESGPGEPTWPEGIGGGVPDYTIKWIAEDQRVKDPNCPNTKAVAIAASKVFAGDDDIVAFSATINPLDWSTLDDSGFIPFGLNTYGSQPITALGLYRSNLVAWNNKAFQMWQVDEDPANFAILDAVPIGSPFYKSGQAVSNDLVFLTEGGIRSMGIAGASTNLQAGSFGKQIDPLILAEIIAISDEDDIISLYYPGAGQYWLIFEETAYVLTMNGGKGDMSWSTYVFPSAIDDWTILDTDLYLRSGLKVWKFDAATLRDDEGDANVVFTGEVWWPYLDFGSLGQTKQMIGFDTVATGGYAVVFGYNQGNAAHVTTSYAISDGDTLYGDIIPMPIAAPSIQMRLTFTGNTAWEWNASSLYLQDWRRTS